jgi:hypothetical protein
MLGRSMLISLTASEHCIAIGVDFGTERHEYEIPSEISQVRGDLNNSGANSQLQGTAES